MKWGWISLAAFLVLVVAMFVVNRPKDELADLRPYITSEENSYERRYGLHGEPDYFFTRTMDVRDLRDSKVQAILKKNNIGKEQCSIFYYDVRIVSAFAPGSKVPDFQVRQVKYSRRLRPGEVVYARLSHFGRNPFE